MKVLGKGRNTALKLLAIGKSVCHVTYTKNIEKLVETPSEVTDSNMEIAVKEVHSIRTNNRDIKSADTHGTVDVGNVKKELLLL